MKNVFLSLIALIFVTACNKPETSSFNENDIEQVKLTMLDYREAWKSGDSAKVLSIICDDVILYSPGEDHKPKIGKDSVAAFWFPPSDIAYPILAYEVTNEKFEGSGNLCLYSGISRLTWHVRKGEVNSDTTTSVTEFLNVMKKERDEWKLYRVMYNLKVAEYE